MRARMLRLLDLLPRNFLFLPGLMMVAVLGLYLGARTFDGTQWVDLLKNYHVVFSGTVAQAETIVTVVAETMVSIASLTFTTVVVVLALASGQFGHRLVRSFMDDKLIQFSLGIFVSTFLYCLLVLHSSFDTPQAMPALTVSLAFYLAIIAGIMLIWFTHHISHMIAAPSIISQVGLEIDESIDRTYPDPIKNTPAAPGHDDVEVALERVRRDGAAVTAHIYGYIETLDTVGLYKLAIKHDAIIELRCRPGDYLFVGSEIAQVWPREHVEALGGDVHQSIIVGPGRTPMQDVRFAFNQIAEIAVRAMSPAMNAPYTAMDCVNRIGAGLARLAQRQELSPFRTDDTGRLRLVVPSVSFAEAAVTALAEVRNYSCGSVIMTLQLLHMIQALAPLLRTDYQRKVMAREATLIRRGADCELSEAHDRHVAQAEYEIAMRLLGAEPEFQSDSETPWRFRGAGGASRWKT